MKNILSSLLSLMLITAQATAQNVGIGTTNATNKLEVVATLNTSSAAVIHGTNSGIAGNAIYGVSHAAGTSGVQGTSNFGVGIYGFSNNYIALGAGATTGTALYASSISGLALSVSGKLRFSGGNTNPSDGAVLTSDASGNAVWKPKKIGFGASGVVDIPVPISTFKKVEFTYQDFDLQDDYALYTGTVSAATSVFTAPVAGIYHFAASLLMARAGGIEATFESAQIRLIKNASSNVLANLECTVFQAGTTYYSPLNIDGDFFLNANDKVWIEVAQRNLQGTSVGFNISPARGRFSGYLKTAE